MTHPEGIYFSSDGIEREYFWRLFFDESFLLSNALWFTFCQVSKQKLSPYYQQVYNKPEVDHSLQLLITKYSVLHILFYITG